MQETSDHGPPQVHGWVVEHHPDSDPGMAHLLRVERRLHEHRSAFQLIEVVECPGLGRVLLLDGAVQLTERDEANYHEMFVHVPLAVHPDVRRVLVIGGGDGGLLRELVRYPAIGHIDLCEIDAGVIDAARRFLPFTACGFDDPRVAVHIGCGVAFLSGATTRYDLILVDSSDPEGPARALFERPFFELLRGALNAGGLVLTQCESIHVDLELIARVLKDARSLFGRVEYLNILVPSYPGGVIGLLVASLGPDPTQPLRSMPPVCQEALRYYTPEVHRAAFVLPRFACRALALGPDPGGSAEGR